MGDEKPTDPQLRRRLAGRPASPAVPGAPPEERTPTDEVPPLAVGGHVQWKNLPTWGKWVGGAVAAFILAVLPAWREWRAARTEEAAKLAEHKAEQAKAETARTRQEQDAVYSKVTKPEIEELRKEVSALKAELAASRRTPAQRRRAAPAPAPKPVPLPASPAAVLQGPPPKAPAPRPPDAGQ